MGLLRALVAGAVAAAVACTLPGAATAAPASTTFRVAGVETAFSSTSAAFSGAAAGDRGDRGVWTTSITRTRFDSSGQSTITGGAFSMSTIGPGWTADRVTGAVAGGSVQKTSGFAGCTNERFLVLISLTGVATRSSSDGTGGFIGQLTHYRTFFFGSCRTYFASVAGQIVFEY
jgi:hypothetical protein